MEKTINIKGNQIALTVEGDPKNPPVIMIHDWASYRGVWQQTISDLKPKYYCIAVDLLGFGASDKPDTADYSLSSQGQRILALAEKLGFQKFSLIGHSMGGEISILLAATIAPQRIEKLVLINSIVTGKLNQGVEKYLFPTTGVFRKLPWLYNIISTTVNIRIFAEIIFRHWFYKFDSISFDTWEKDRIDSYNPACFISLDESKKAIKEVDLTQQLRKIQAKTLIIASKQDGMVPQDQFLLSQTLIPNNDLALIEKCGHFPMYEKKGNYLKALALIF